MRCLAIKRITPSYERIFDPIDEKPPQIVSEPGPRHLQTKVRHQRSDALGMRHWERIRRRYSSFQYRQNVISCHKEAGLRVTRIMFLSAKTVADNNVAVPIAITGPGINMEIRNNIFANAKLRKPRKFVNGL